MSTQAPKRHLMIQPPLEPEEGATPAPAPIKPIPTPSDLPKVDKPEKPEDPLPLPTPRSQEVLAEEGLAQQTVRNKAEMTPFIDTTPPYAFTDKDRAKAAASHWIDFDWDNAPLDEALNQLAIVRAETEKGGIALQRRISENRLEKVKCYSCDNIINISEGRWAGMRTRNNFDTGLPESAFACSARCNLIMNREFVHPTSRVTL